MGPWARGSCNGGTDKLSVFCNAVQTMDPIGVLGDPWGVLWAPEGSLGIPWGSLGLLWRSLGPYNIEKVMFYFSGSDISECCKPHANTSQNGYDGSMGVL